MIDINEVIEIAEKAGEIVMRYHEQGFNVETKQDEFDFVTQADIEADTYIRQQLQKLFPQDFILSEESDITPESFSKNVWMVDPLDGTKDFVNKGTGFSIMIGLCKNGVPMLGVVYAPAKKKMYYAEKGKGSYLKSDGKVTSLSVSSISNIKESRVVTRHAHGEIRDSDKMIFGINAKEYIPESSVGVKLGLISEGNAEIQIHTNTRGNKWDTCAPQVILEEAGGKLTNHKGESLDYMQESCVWGDSFVGTNGYLHDDVIKYIQSFGTRS